MPDQDADELIVLNGINARTGRYLVDPMKPDEVAELAREALAPAPVPLASAGKFRAVGFNLDATKPSSVGWGLIVPSGTSSEILDALRPLVALRKSQVPADRLKVLEYKPGETMKAWLKRYGVYPGTVSPTKVPYYLLIVGEPSQVPFEFQYLLDIEYAVGRVSFADVDAYRRYAQGLVDYETAATAPTAREVAFWGTRHAGDAATQMSADSLITPLLKGHAAVGDDPAENPIADDVGFRSRGFVAAEATRANLSTLLHPPADAPRPAVLVTASHGMGFPKGDPQQTSTQGALLTQDWAGLSTISPTDYFAAADVSDAASVHGLMALVFACYGLGTPAYDAFLTNRGTGPVPIADRPFVAALPQRLLGHPNGGALGVLGHVERAWGYSIRPKGMAPQIGPLRNFLGYLMEGQPVGHASRDISGKYAELCAELLDLLDTTQGRTPSSDAALARAWIERNDAQNYALLGDPAARLRVEILA